MQESVTTQYVRGERSAAEYWAEEFVRYDFSETCSGSMQLVDRLRTAIDTGFWRLDSLSRTNPFWNCSNGLATAHKLNQFAEFEMDLDAHAIDAAWLAIALEIYHGATQFTSRPWRVLLASQALQSLATRGDAEASWAADAARYFFQPDDMGGGLINR